jgi:cobalt/nickel transport protein
MPIMRQLFFVPLLILAAPAAARAHYNMLLPDPASVQRGKPVTFSYQWGHPFEHELFDAPMPEGLTVFGPDNKTTDLLKSLKKVTVKSGKKDVAAYQFTYTPEEPGDYIFVVQTPPIWMAAEGEYFQDTAKVVVHVQAQKGWDRLLNLDFEFAPLTRPYGLVAGNVFQAGIQRYKEIGPLGNPLGNGRATPLAGLLVEIERYNSEPPKELPADEFMTRTVKTDANGVVTCDLPEAGWWCLTAAREAGTRQREGKTVSVRQRSSLWVYVNEKPRP